MNCFECGPSVDVQEKDAIYDRGYWWCRKHSQMWDANTVDFPSSGKLAPSTIMTTCDRRVKP